MVSAPPRAVNSIVSTLSRVHRDIADVAEKPHPAAIGRDVDLLADVRAVEQRACRSRLRPKTVSLPSPGFHTNVSSPSPSEAVSLPRPPTTRSLPAPPISLVGAVAARDRVIAVAAIEREADEAGEPIAGGDDVVAAASVEDKALGGADVESERRRGHAIEADARAVRRDGEGFGAVAAVHERDVVAVSALEECRCRRQGSRS